MIRYSCYSSAYDTATKDEVENFLKTTNKPFKYTYGFEYRNPTTHRVPITREQALKYWHECADVCEYDDFVHIQQFSANDMW